MNRKSFKIFFLTVLTVVFVTGCASSPDRACNQANKVPSPVAPDEKLPEVPAGSGILCIRTAIKTHCMGYYRLEPAGTFHGAASLPVEITMNGVTSQWILSGAPHSKPLYDTNGKRMADPEAGDGIMYTLDRSVALEPGRCDVKISLGKEQPESDFSVIIEPGKITTVELVPMYCFCHNRTRSRSFEHGISEFRVKTSDSPVVK